MVGEGEVVGRAVGAEVVRSAARVGVVLVRITAAAGGGQREQKHKGGEC
jgi:hypothetical protein